MLNVHEIWMVWVYESETPLIFRDEEKARFTARKLRGTCATVDSRSISNYGLINITDEEKLNVG